MWFLHRRPIEGIIFGSAAFNGTPQNTSTREVHRLSHEPFDTPWRAVRTGFANGHEFFKPFVELRVNARQKISSLRYHPARNGRTLFSQFETIFRGLTI